MKALDWVFFLVTLVSVCFTLRYWIELRRWAHLIKYGRVVVAYKAKVKLNAPLQEWALWCRAAQEDDSVNGRVIYHLGGTRIAILKKSFVPQNRFQRILTKLTRPEGKSAKAGKRAADGTWQVASDDTKPVKVNGD